MMVFEEALSIKLIKVEDRARKDLGDLDDLVSSIKEKGVLQPVIVDTDYKLVAGGRRLAAAELAGLLVIPAIIRRPSAVTGLDKRLDALEIELHEIGRASCR